MILVIFLLTVTSLAEKSDEWKQLVNVFLVILPLHAVYQWRHCSLMNDYLNTARFFYKLNQSQEILSQEMILYNIYSQGYL